MNKKVRSIIAALVLSGSISTVGTTIAEAATTNCQASINEKTSYNYILSKYSELENLITNILNKVSPSDTNAKTLTNTSTTSNNTTSTTTTKADDPAKQTTETTTQPAASNENSSKNDGQSSSTISAEAAEVVRLVNIERIKNGLAPLKANSELSKVATIKAQDMIDKNYFSHTSPTYGSPFDMMTKFGISYTTAGENIAYGQKTPAEVMDAWMNSQGHRANILNSNFTEIGVGLAKDKNGTPYWVQMFINPSK
jgi:uncharacterized YkwD family protein